jgi:hypothetical protein
VLATKSSSPIFFFFPFSPVRAPGRMPSPQMSFLSPMPSPPQPRVPLSPSSGRPLSPMATLLPPACWSPASNTLFQDVCYRGIPINRPQILDSLVDEVVSFFGLVVCPFFCSQLFIFETTLIFVCLFICLLIHLGFG